MSNSENNDLILEDFLPYRLSILSNTVSANIGGAYEHRFGLSIPEWRVVAVLARFPGLSAVEVAEQTRMDKVAVSRAVSKLIKAERVDRQFADSDRRRSILNLSDKGQTLHSQVAPLALRYEQELLQGLKDEEIDTLNTLIERLLARATILGSPNY